jgi:hypothetical protein
MKIRIIHGEDTQGLALRALSPEELADMRRFVALSGRIGLYGMPVVMLIWIYLVFPVIFPEQTPLPYLAIQLLCVIIFTPFIHELLHLLAWPWKIFHPDTTLFLRRHGLHSNMAIRFGGKLTREQAIWVTALPFLLLTLLPFGLLLVGYPPPITVGLMAALNFALSSQDLMQIIAYLISCSYGQRLQ